MRKKELILLAFCVASSGLVLSFNNDLNKTILAPSEEVGTPITVFDLVIDNGNVFLSWDSVESTSYDIFTNGTIGSENWGLADTVMANGDATTWVTGDTSKDTLFYRVQVAEPLRVDSGHDYALMEAMAGGSGGESFVNEYTGADVNITTSGATSSGFTVTYDAVSSGDSRVLMGMQLSSPLQLAVGDSALLSFTWNSTQIGGMNQGFRWGFDFGSNVVQACSDTRGPASVFHLHRYDTTGDPLTASGTDESWVNPPTALPASGSYFMPGNLVSVTTTLTRVSSETYTMDVTWGGETYSSTAVFSSDHEIDSIFFMHGQASGGGAAQGDNLTISNVSLELYPDVAFENEYTGPDVDITTSGVTSNGFTVTYDAVSSGDSRVLMGMQLSSPLQLAVGDSALLSFTWNSTQIGGMNQGFRWGFDFGSNVVQACSDTRGPASVFHLHRYDTTGDPLTASGTDESWVNPPTALPASGSYFMPGNFVSVTTTLTRVSYETYTMDVTWGGETYSSTAVFSSDHEIDSIFFMHGQASGGGAAQGDNLTISNVSLELHPDVAFENEYTGPDVDITTSGVTSDGFTVTYDAVSSGDSRVLTTMQLSSPLQLAVGDSALLSFTWNSTQIGGMNQGFRWGFDFGSNVVQACSDTRGPASVFHLHRYDTTGDPLTASGTDESWVNPPTALPASGSYFMPGNFVSVTTTLTRVSSETYTMGVTWGGETYSSTAVFSSDHEIDSIFFMHGQASGGGVAQGDNLTISNVSLAWQQAAYELSDDFVNYIKSATNPDLIGQGTNALGEACFYPYFPPMGPRIAYDQPIPDKAHYLNGWLISDAEDALRSELQETVKQLRLTILQQTGQSFDSLALDSREILIDFGYSEGVSSLDINFVNAAVSLDWSVLMDPWFYVRYEADWPDRVRNKAYITRWGDKGGL